MATFEIVEQEGKRFVKIGLENETVRAGSGALSTMSYCRTYAGPGRLLVSRAPYWQFGLFGPQPTAASPADAA